MGNESVLCPVCQGVVPASGRDAYTPLRGRLILTNGYCGGDCADRRGVDRERTQQVARPVAAPGPVQGQAQGHLQGHPQGQAYGYGQEPVQAPLYAPAQVPVAVGPGVRR